MIDSPRLCVMPEQHLVDRNSVPTDPTTDSRFGWVPFYRELAEKLLTYRDQREVLSSLIRKLAVNQPLLNYLHFENDEWWGPRNYLVDPFTIFGSFNRGISDGNRTLLVTALAAELNITAPAPTEFSGIPVLHNQKSFFAGTDEIWDLFTYVMECTSLNGVNDRFAELLDSTTAIDGNGAPSITMALYWVRPDLFMPLDRNSNPYILRHYGLTAETQKGNGQAYVKYLHTLHSEISDRTPHLTLPELSYTAWTNTVTNGTSEPKSDASPQSMDLSKESTSMSNSPHHDQNTILYGAPGTGKTYSTTAHAVAIIEEKPVTHINAEPYDEVHARYTQYKHEGLIAFVTFHQSFGYEEFVEGIRPTLQSDELAEGGNQLEYELRSGLFKAFCDNAAAPAPSLQSSVGLGIGKSPAVWKVSLGGTGDNPTRADCLQNDHIRVGWDEYGEHVTDTTDFSHFGGRAPLNAFYNRMQVGDIIFSTYSSKTIDAIGVVTGDPSWDEHYPQYKRVRPVRWLATNLAEDITELNGGKVMTLSTVYGLSVTASDAIALLKRVLPDEFAAVPAPRNKVFIIDEINRGNISKIFGELITLLEPTKRIGASEELRITLPYSGHRFGVPDNVYVLGTMNTADRSIALIDTALRRRFTFIEMLPNHSLLSTVTVQNINIGRLLEVMNKRITVLLDREHVIGHAYFMPLVQRPTLGHLATIFQHKILPLLQEYFYDDYAKIQLVLGDNQKHSDEAKFLISHSNFDELLGGHFDEAQEFYEVQVSAFMKPEAYDFLA